MGAARDGGIGRSRAAILAFAFLAGVGCGSIDAGDAAAAEENLARRIGDALKTQEPKPPDADPLVSEYLAKSGSGGPWSLPDAEPLADRVNPAPGEAAPAPGGN